MKAALVLWVCTVLVAHGFSGVIITPVVVRVFDMDGYPVANASVEIRDNGLAGVIKNEIDPNSKLAQFARKADGARKTDTLGCAILYFGGGFIPDKDNGTKTTPSGTVIVKADGYQDANVPFRRIVRSSPEGKTELMLCVSIELKPAEQVVEPDAGDAPE